MAELKPCPFCGGAARTYTYNSTNKGKEQKLWLCQCVKCRVNYPSLIVSCKHESEAVEAWNRRAPM